MIWLLLAPIAFVSLLGAIACARHFDHREIRAFCAWLAAQAPPRFSFRERCAVYAVICAIGGGASRIGLAEASAAAAWLAVIDAITDVWRAMSVYRRTSHSG